VHVEIMADAHAARIDAVPAAALALPSRPRDGASVFDAMEPVELEHDGTHLRGYAAHPDVRGRVPAVLVMHSGVGIVHAVNVRVAHMLAERGYLAVCTDMYGARFEGASTEEAGVAYGESLADPERQRARTVAWFDEIARRPDVDDTRIAAIGFCFGGMTALELARSGADLRAAVSYHGILTTHRRAEPGTIPGRVVAYCGANDPYAPLADIDDLRHEMEHADVTYQITIFGGVGHGFTNPDAADLQLDGIRYDQLANDASWSGTQVLLHLVFSR
jgi:dienelactone hydrolase